MVKNITYIGPQSTPEVTNVSRDGGYSVLINGNIVWLYDDTECMGYAGNQLSFVSNTAAYAHQPNKNESTVKDFGVVMVGKDQYGRKEYAILADKTVGTGGWIPFMQDELDFNKQKNGEERVAICECKPWNSVVSVAAMLSMTRQGPAPPLLRSVLRRLSCMHLLSTSTANPRILLKSTNLEA